MINTKNNTKVRVFVALLALILCATLMPAKTSAESHRTKKVYYGKTLYKTISGYAGKQPKKGTRVRTGGSIIWIDRGGPSASVSIGLGAGYGAANVSCSLGIFGGTAGRGVGMDVPSKKKHYKIKVWKKYTVRRYKFYQWKCRKGKMEWKLICKGATRGKNPYTLDYGLVRMD